MINKNNWLEKEILSSINTLKRGNIETEYWHFNQLKTPKKEHA